MGKIKGKHKKWLKIAAGALAFILIGIVLTAANAFVGNPVSAALANKAVQTHLDQTYAGMDLYLERKARYNFKDGSYTAIAASKSSNDTKFYIAVRKGEILWDEYEFAVLSKQTTIDRLSREYSEIARQLIAREAGGDWGEVRVMYDDNYDRQYDEYLELDMPFDKSLPIPANLSLGLHADQMDVAFIGKSLTDVHELLAERGYAMEHYNIYGENEIQLIAINGVKPEHIISGQLVQKIEKALELGEYEGISAFMKGGEK